MIDVISMVGNATPVLLGLQRVLPSILLLSSVYISIPVALEPYLNILLVRSLLKSGLLQRSIAANDPAVSVSADGWS